MLLSGAHPKLPCPADKTATPHCSSKTTISRSDTAQDACAYLAFAFHRAVLVYVAHVKFRACTLSVEGHHNRPSSARFRQRHRRAAMYNAERLMSTGARFYHRPDRPANLDLFIVLSLVAFVEADQMAFPVVLMLFAQRRRHHHHNHSLA